MSPSDLHKELQMAAGVKCTARTVQNRLLEAELKSYKARKKPLINEKQKRARIMFAKDRTNLTIEDWNNVVFSDESEFSALPNTQGSPFSLMTLKVYNNDKNIVLNDRTFIHFKMRNEEHEDGE